MNRPLLALAAASALLGACSSVAPVKPLTAGQIGQLSGMTELTLAQVNFRAQALGRVSGKPGPTDTEVARQAGATAATLASLQTKTYAINPTPAPATSAAPPGGSVFDFKKSGDAGQAWATTTAAGMPFLFVQAFGQVTANAAASWTASVTTTPGHENVYVQFRLPKARVDGFTEQNGPSDWQSRVRAEFAINGHPFWMAEASRLSQLDPAGQGGGGDNCAGGYQGSNKVLAWGTSVGFSDAQTTSSAQTVTLWLGSFPAGQTVGVGFIARADAQVKRQCCPKDAMGNPEFFCTRATAGVDWDNAATPVRIWIGPPVS